MFKVKYHLDRSVARYKVRFVGQGYSQIPGIDFNKTFAPTVQHKFLKIFLAISTLFNLLVEQIDIIRTYLESLMGDNKLPIFMKLPSRMRDLQSVRAGLVSKFLKGIYELKQSGRLWNQKVIGFFKTLRFKLLNTDPNILIANRDGKILMISIYVDNFLLVSRNPRALQWLKNSISNESNMKDLGEVCIIIR